MAGAASLKRRTYWKLLIRGYRQRALFDAVSTFCLFLGQPRSGHTLVGAMLNAHKNAVIAHELDFLDYVQSGWRRNPIYCRILKRDRRFTQGGSVGSGYSYRVPNQWQGRFESLEVIGDKRAGAASRRFGSDPGLLRRMRRIVRVPIRMIHVVRNPYDNISTIARREGRTLADAADYYFSMCDSAVRTMAELTPEELHNVRHEDVVADPVGRLAELSRFLGLPLYPGYLEDCASIVWVRPTRPRDEAPWTDALKSLVAGRTAAIPHLRGYGFED
jgi:hypothetical protein